MQGKVWSGDAIAISPIAPPRKPKLERWESEHLGVLRPGRCSSAFPLSNEEVGGPSPDTSWLSLLLFSSSQ